ncbi:MAG: acetyl-CoA decarbonylase/synthase complex subunit gamma [Anaerolineales bacterium]|nr:acetyl-CoA decarbonylase/synthase complex subunit gamma [Anaerolineales bacterium]
MALSGIQIYKLLPQTNCKDCGFPTCLAFAMKLAAKQVELAACPHVSEESKTKLAESAAPPIRLVTIKSDGYEVKAGNEVVLFRHEKTFYHKPGLFIRVRDEQSPEEIQAKITPIEKYQVNYVGIDLALDGFAVKSTSGDSATFANAVSAVRQVSQRPLILMSPDPKVISAGLMAVDGESPLIHAANADNWESMADLAKKHQCALVVTADTLDELADLTEKIIAKDAGFIILDTFTPEMAYPLLVLRQNIYTDPQKPIQVQPGLYEINNPGPQDPVLVTTNFSITYFSVANEVEASGLPSWLLVTDAEGMSVLTAWAAGKFDSERIAKSVKEFNVGDKVSQKRVVLPGHVAVLSGELEEELPGWEIRVGPREAVDIPSFMKQAL